MAAALVQRGAGGAWKEDSDRFDGEDVEGGGAGKEMREERATDGFRNGVAGDWRGDVGEESNLLGPKEKKKNWFERRCGCGCCKPPRRPVSLYWAEKWLEVWFFVQWYGILWNYSSGWPWPLLWRRWAAWALAPLADFVSFDAIAREAAGGSAAASRRYESVWGESAGYRWWVVGWGGLVILCMCMGLILIGLNRRFMWLNRRVLEPGVWDTLVVGGMLLQAPILLHVGRAFPCELRLVVDQGNLAGASAPTTASASDAGPGGLWVLLGLKYEGIGAEDVRWSIDPSVQCWETGHVILMGCALVPFLILAVGLPVWLWYTAGRNVMVSWRRPHSHERHLRTMETEHSFGLSEEYRVTHAWVLSSFRRGWLHPYSWSLRLLSTTVLIVAFLVLRWFPQALGDLWLVMVLLWGLRQMIVPGYRVTSSNWTASLIWIGALFSAIFAIFRAHGTVSAITVDSAYTLWMLWGNGAFAVLIILLFSAALFPWLFPGDTGLGGWPRGTLLRPEDFPPGAEQDIHDPNNSSLLARSSPQNHDLQGHLLTSGHDQELDAALQTRARAFRAGLGLKHTDLTENRGHELDGAQGALDSGMPIHGPRASSVLPDPLKDAARRRAAAGRVAPSATESGRKWGEEEDAWTPLSTRDVMALERRWIAKIRLGLEVVDWSHRTANILQDPDMLEATGSAVLSDAIRARRARHVLGRTLTELAEQLFDIAARAEQVTALRRHPHLRQSSILLAQILNSRENASLLSDPRRSRILLKLLAVRAFLSLRTLQPMPHTAHTLASAPALINKPSFFRPSSQLPQRMIPDPQNDSQSTILAKCNALRTDDILLCSHQQLRHTAKAIIILNTTQPHIQALATAIKARINALQNQGAATLTQTDQDLLDHL